MKKLLSLIFAALLSAALASGTPAGGDGPGPIKVDPDSAKTKPVDNK